VIARVPSSRNNAGLGIDSGNASQSFQPAVTSPGFGQSGSHRITARVSQSGPVTEADPILTRVGLGRSDSGSTFGLFLQVYADGTVIDSEGVHHLSISQIRQVLNVIRGHDFSRIKGHCGQPSADFVENVQMIVYDRSLGRLRAHPFSYSGNPDGCDDSVAHLHKAVEDLVLQIAGSKSGAGPIVNEVTNDPSENMGVLSQTFSGSSSTNVGLPQVIEQPAQAQAYSGASSGTNYAQGTVVPRLPTTSISPSQPPTVSGGGLPSLNPPR
jgi:hypothetical protein